MFCFVKLGLVNISITASKVWLLHKKTKQETCLELISLMRSHPWERYNKKVHIIHFWKTRCLRFCFAGGTVSEVLKKLVLLLLKVCMLIYAFRNVLISYEKKMFLFFIFYSWHWISENLLLRQQLPFVVLSRLNFLSLLRIWILLGLGPRTECFLLNFTLAREQTLTKYWGLWYVSVKG